MKVLIATAAMQGTRPGDYCATIEGELVTPLAVECCSPSECGCQRGFPGLASSRATTTAMVVDRPDIDREALTQAVNDSLERGGWFGELDDDECSDLVTEHLEAIEAVCSHFPVGAIVERSTGTVSCRGVMLTFRLDLDCA